MAKVNPMVAVILLLSFTIAVTMIMMSLWEHYTGVHSFYSYTTAVCNEDCSMLQDIQLVCSDEKLLGMRTVGSPVPNTMNRTPIADYCRR